MLSKKDYRVREKKVINDLPGFKPQPLSGAGIDHKEDGLSSQFLLQLKSTEDDSIRVSIHVLAELFRNSKMCNKKPVLMLDFVNSATLFCIRKEDFLLFHKWLDEREDAERIRKELQLSLDLKNNGHEEIHSESEHMF